MDIILCLWRDSFKVADRLPTLDESLLPKIHIIISWHRNLAIKFLNPSTLELLSVGR